jgi:hypothetical protein
VEGVHVHQLAAHSLRRGRGRPAHLGGQLHRNKTFEMALHRSLQRRAKQGTVRRHSMISLPPLVMITQHPPILHAPVLLLFPPLCTCFIF